jgi:hypothetical protein
MFRDDSRRVIEIYFYSGSKKNAQIALQDLLNIPGSIAKIVERIAPPQLDQFFGAPPAPSESVGRAE